MKSNGVPGGRIRDHWSSHDHGSVDGVSMDSMKAAGMYAPGGPEVWKVESRPIPKPQPGWVLIRVKALPQSSQGSNVTSSPSTPDTVPYGSVPDRRRTACGLAARASAFAAAAGW